MELLYFLAGGIILLLVIIYCFLTFTVYLIAREVLEQMRRKR